MIGEYISALSNSAALEGKEKGYLIWGVIIALQWQSFETTPYEMRTAKENVTEEEITQLLDCASYYTLMKLPLPSNRNGSIHNMKDEEFIREMDNGQYAITNMGIVVCEGFISVRKEAVGLIAWKRE